MISFGIKHNQKGSMLTKRIVYVISRIVFLLLLLIAVSRIFIILIFFTIHYSKNHNNNSHSSCSPSSCGNVPNIKYPFRLKTDPTYCGYNSSAFVLDCQNNQAIVNISSRRYFLQEINYKKRSAWVVDPGIKRGNLSSCPLNSYPTNRYIDGFIFSPDLNVPVAYIHCLSPINHVKYVKAPFCGNRSNIFSNSSELYSYLMVGEARVLDLEESCTLDKVAWVSAGGPMTDNYSLVSIYDGLADGFKPLYRVGGDCWVNGSYFLFKTVAFKGIHFNVMYFEYKHCCYDFSRVPPEEKIKCKDYSVEASIGIYAALIVAGFAAIKFVIGFPLLIWLVVHTWQSRHLSMDKTIEDFLQNQHNLAPIKYTFSEIKKMTNNFAQKLGEGANGTVYKGKLRSGSYVAIKIMEASVTREEEFINEVGTIGLIHHVNIVQLIGFCVQRSNYALVYEFLPNGSLDRYLFNQQCLDNRALTFEKMLEIALGIARGIDYLHQGCDVQILHFDIKPHNILLDEKFNPKISDFGLAQLHPAKDESVINLTSARGTMGYMAPEIFYKNIGGISYKADVYSFGMMLMEMATKRKNMNPRVEDTSQLNFPSWAYEQLCAGKNIDVKDATEEEKKMVKKFFIVALWCMQMRPSRRPPMSKVVEMLESWSDLQMPPNPFFAPHEMANDDHGINY